MLLPRLQPSLRGAITSITRSAAAGNVNCLNEAFGQLSLRATTPSLVLVRHASHAQQGAVNKGKDGRGKRLGAKRSGEQYVIPGNIIFRQRGTLWYPGENCAMGRDHTIYATQCGYVKYYKDPEKNPKRQYIGVVFERDQVLPLPRNSVRRRRLGMEVRKIELPVEETLVEGAVAESVEGVQVLEGVQKVAKAEPKRKERRGEEGRNLTLSPVGYMYREANWQIGRAAERAKVKVREFTPRDRWTAWRKSAIRKGKNLEKRRLGRSLGGKKKEKK